MLRVREAIIAGRDRSSCSPSLFWRFESFGANPANRQLGPAFAAWPPDPADLLFAEIRTILPSALRVPRGLRPSQDHPVQARRDAGGQVFANQASFASLTDRRALRRCSSAKQKVDEYSARQKSGSRNQKPANPIPQKRSRDNTKTDSPSDDSFHGKAYRKHREKRPSKRERGKGACKQHGSP